MKSITKSITFSILEKIAEAGELTLDAWFPPGYPEADIARLLFGLDNASKKKVSRRTVATLLSRLQSQGLVQHSGRSKFSTWHITRAGKEKVKQGFKIVPPLPEPDGHTRLVIFDIPEYDRKKRTAVRLELVAAGFTQLQRSVWIGDRPLPKDFIGFLDAFELEGMVHIFSVRQRGTLTAKHTS